MYLFSSIRSRQAEESSIETEKHNSEATESEASEKAPDKDTSTLYHAFSAPPLIPEDVAVLINLINGSIRRGTLSLEEVRVLLKSYDKLAACVHSQPEWFHFESEKVPLGEYGDESAVPMPESCTDVPLDDAGQSDVRQAKWVAAYRRNRKKAKARMRRAAKRRARRKKRS